MPELGIGDHEVASRSGVESDIPAQPNLACLSCPAQEPSRFHLEERAESCARKQRAGSVECELEGLGRRLGAEEASHRQRMISIQPWLRSLLLIHRRRRRRRVLTVAAACTRGIVLAG